MFGFRNIFTCVCVRMWEVGEVDQPECCSMNGEIRFQTLSVIGEWACMPASGFQRSEDGDTFSCKLARTALCTSSGLKWETLSQQIRNGTSEEDPGLGLHTCTYVHTWIDGHTCTHSVSPHLWACRHALKDKHTEKKTKMIHRKCKGSPTQDRNSETQLCFLNSHRNKLKICISV